VKTNIQRLAAFALIAFAIISLPSIAHASTSSGTAMPWESPLKTIADSLSGPVAGIISLIALAVCGATLVFGGEIGEFAKKMVYIVMVIAVLVGASSLISTLFSSSGALI
jgi:type IV secretory pathway VirB2 component (pilin)